MKKTLLAAALLLSTSVSANNWVAGGSYIDLSDDSDNADLSLGVLALNVGYQFDIANSNWVVIPEAKLGLGIKDDEVSTFIGKVDIEVERYMSLGARLQFNANNKVFFYLVPSYANVKLEAESRGYSVSDDDWEFGVGAGVGYQFTEKASADLSYEKFDDTDAIQVGFRYSF